MKFFTQAHHAQLLKNGSAEQRGKDHFPVVKLFSFCSTCIWLLTEIDPAKPDMALGLCDLGHGFPELGYVSLIELASLRGRLGFPIECDHSFVGKFPISVYASASRIQSEITLNKSELERFAVPQKQGQVP